jgi:hypothetical protein
MFPHDLDPQLRAAAIARVESILIKDEPHKPWPQRFPALVRAASTITTAPVTCGSNP